MILRAFFFGTVLYAFIWSKRNFSFIILYSSCFWKNAFNRGISFLMRWQSYQEWHLSQKSRILLFYPLAACCGGRVNIFQKNKLTLNNAVCFAICNQPTKLVLNLCPFGLEGFCQLTCYYYTSFWANYLSTFFSNIFHNIFKIIFRNFFLGLITLLKSTLLKNLILQNIHLLNINHFSFFRAQYLHHINT